MPAPQWILLLPDIKTDTELSITLNEAAQQDCESLTQLAMASKQHWGYSQEFMQSCYAELAVTPHKLAHHDFYYKKALLAGQIAGFYCLQKLSANKFELEALFVSPEHIGKGIGQWLWQDLLNAASTQGGEQLLIASDPHAEAFYLKMGAVKTGDIPSGSIPGRSLPLLVLELFK